MLRRKIEESLLQWKQQAAHKPLIIKGCRQCGKTSSVLKFAKEQYKHCVYLNFFERPELATVFQGSLEVDKITMLLTAILGKQANFSAGETVIILDEIQVCPEARAALKFFALDGRYDVIATGSLLGVKGYGEIRSVPVGYESTIVMRPLDFEEFLWANDISDEVISLLCLSAEAETALPQALHQRMKELLLQYVVVGGMPAVVQSFVDTKNMALVLQLQRDIIASYQDDMVKYAAAADKGKIRECFLSIPKQLSKENKKFQYSVVRKKATASQYEGSLQWIEDAGIIVRCYNLSATELPLDGNAIDNIFKVYMADIGLLIAMLEDGTQADILQGRLLGYKGAIFENLMADVLSKMGRKLYYFHKDSGLELDFLIRYKGKCTPLEVKANNGQAKSLKTVLAQPQRYKLDGAIKLGDYNIGRNDNILTLPLYMGFLLKER